MLALYEIIKLINSHSHQVTFCRMLPYIKCLRLAFYDAALAIAMPLVSNYPCRFLKPLMLLEVSEAFCRHSTGPGVTKVTDAACVLSGRL